MFKSFVKTFIKNSEEINDPAVREKYGKLTGITGIILNFFMCAGKIITGILTGAISIVSDGINNLSDAGSSIITLIGFKLAAKKPDKKHPYGHGRIEYFAGLAVSVIIIIVAVTLFVDSLKKIIDGEILTIESMPIAIVTVAVLGVSIILKLWMALLNRYTGKKIKSVAMSATSLDCVTDCISTSVVLICTILSFFVRSFPIDACAGIVVSLFIAFTGLRSVKEVVDLLLGEAPDPEFVKEIADFVKHYDQKIVGIHDLMFHDYGPGRKILVLHVEVPAEDDILELHDMIDNIETDTANKFNCITTIHMDPVVTKSERVTHLKELCYEIVKSIDPEFNMHDFRMNEGGSHANLIFDVVVPPNTKLTAEQISNEINARLKEKEGKLNAVIKVENSFV